ncbi:MAG TPA: restriction endonuclease subunit S, partial [Nitrospinota bacterium]|nr:restriction endonuclease subunit S [Nitrospinota bacterium]
GKPLGKSCIIPIDQKPGIFVADIVRVRPNIKEFDREYLVFAINSFIAQLQFSSLTKGTTRPRVNLKQMREINIPIAPFEEQKHIVEKIKKILSFIDSIDKSVHSAIAHSEELTQSILAKAFRGELVEQDPNDEPAAILLEKIAKKKSTSSK